MKKIYTLLYFVPTICFAQLAVPNATVQSSVNPETGNVGVGTLSPQAKLDVDFNSEIKKIQFYQPGTKNPLNETVSSLRYVWYDSNADIGMVRSSSTPIDALNIRFNNEEKIRFKSNGNVGIGTTNPDRLLTLSTDSYLGWEYGKGLGSYHTITGGGINPMTFSVYPFSDPNAPIFSFSGYSGEKLTILNSGNVGIGTALPSEKLEVNGSIFSQTENAFIGIDAGTESRIGFVKKAGFGPMLSSGSSEPLIFGSWSTPNIKNNITTGNYKETFRISPNGDAALKGKLEAKEIKVTTSPTADFVFEENYNLPKLEDVEKHIKEKKNLPEIASAKEMEANGVNVGAFQIKLLQKIEELTLYTIEQNKEIRTLKDRIERMEKSK